MYLCTRVGTARKEKAGLMCEGRRQPGMNKCTTYIVKEQPCTASNSSIWECYIMPKTRRWWRFAWLSFAATSSSQVLSTSTPRWGSEMPPRVQCRAAAKTSWTFHRTTNEHGTRLLLTDGLTEQHHHWLLLITWKMFLCECHTSRRLLVQSFDDLVMIIIEVLLRLKLKST